MPSTKAATTQQTANLALMKIGELAKRLDVTPRTVRYYESLGLVQPCGRTDGGFRLYGGAELELLTSIISFKELGLSLEQIRGFLKNAGEGCDARHVFNKVQEEFAACERDLGLKIEHLANFQSEISRARAILQKCPGCNNKPFDGECLACWERAGTVPRPLKVLARIALK